MTEPPESDRPETPGGFGSAPIGDRGLTEEGDRGHAAYAQPRVEEARALGGLVASVELHDIRDPLSWRDAVETWDNRQQLHDAFMYGMQQLQGRSEREGWVHEYTLDTPIGDRRVDAAKVLQLGAVPTVVTSTEYKSGFVPGREGLKQLDKEDYLLERNPELHSEYVIRSVADLDNEIAERVERLKAKYPDRFHVMEVPAQQFEQALAIGRPIVQAKAIDKLRENPNLTVARDAIRGFAREIEQGRKEGRPVALEVLLGGRANLQELIDVDRQVIARYDQMAREKGNLKLKAALLVEQHQAQTREERHQGLVSQLEPIDKEIQRSIVEVAEQARIPEQQREQMREQAQQLERTAAGREELAVQREQRRLKHQLMEAQGMERAAERDALERAGLTPDHVDQVAQRLDHDRESRDKAVTQGLARVDAQLQEQRNGREMAEEIERHNQVIQAVARVGVENARREQHGRDPHEMQEHQKTVERIVEAARSLQLDPDKDRTLNAKVYQAFRDGTARWDRGAGRWLVEIDGRPTPVPERTPERLAGEAARYAGENWNPLAIVEVTRFSHSIPELDTGRAIDSAALGQAAERTRQQEQAREPGGRDRN